MIVTTIEDALRLVLDWSERTDIPLPPRDTAQDRPASLAQVIAVSDALGPGILAPGTDVFLSTQYRIMRPEVLRPSPQGYCTFIVDPQGAFSLGFKPDAPELLFVSGDWATYNDETVPPGWRRLPMSTEDALILAVLTNAFFGLSERMKIRDEQDFSAVPPDTATLLWHHDGMGVSWPGFWTDAANSRLYFGGFGQTLLRA